LRQEGKGFCGVWIILEGGAAEMDVISTSVGAAAGAIENVVVHPLVLLSIVDN
jgi:hypothetical protein